MFYNDMVRTLYNLPDKQLVVMFKALAEAILYHRFKETPEELDGDPVMFAMYDGFLQRILYDGERYAEICEKRAEAGRQKGKAKEIEKAIEK